MIIKTYLANTIEEVEESINQELGPNAVILTSRHIRPKGLRALFSSNKFEVTAAVEEEDYRLFSQMKAQKNAEAAVNQPIGKQETLNKETQLNSSRNETYSPQMQKEAQKLSKEEPSHGDLEPHSGKETVIKDLSATYQDPRFHKKEKSPDFSQEALLPGEEERKPKSLQETAFIMQENQEIRSSSESDRAPQTSVNPHKASFSSDENQKQMFVQAGLRLLAKFHLDRSYKTQAHGLSPLQMHPLYATDDEGLRQIVREEMAAVQVTHQFAQPSMENLFTNDLGRFLISKGISASISIEIEKKLKEEFGDLYLMGASAARSSHLNALKRELALRIKVAGPICLKKGQPTICAFVGPTGVGKTLTLVKIACQYQSELDKKVVIISSDSIKAGAFEQIKLLCHAYNLSYAKGSSNEELEQVLGIYSDHDLILIDTAGCGQYHWQEVDDLLFLLSGVNDVHTYLTMSATTKDVDVYGIIQQFSRLNVESLIFTKLDETIAQGLFVNVCQKTGKSISYLTTGNRIPEDLKIANPEDLARSILVQHNSAEFAMLRQMAKE